MQSVKEAQPLTEVQPPESMKSLPMELFFAFLYFLSVADVKQLRRVSKFFHFLIDQSNQYWEYQISLLSKEQRSDVGSDNYKKVILARHFLRGNLRNTLVPSVVGISFFGATPIPVSTEKGYLSSITSALNSKLISSNIPIQTKFHLCYNFRDIEIDLNEISNIILSDNAEAFIVASSKLGKMLPYIGGGIDRAIINGAINKLDENNEVVRIGNFTYFPVFVNSLIDARAIECFRISLKLYVAIIVFPPSSIFEKYFKEVIDSTFTKDNSLFKQEVLKIISLCGDDGVLEYTLDYLIESHRESLKKLFCSNHDLFSQVFLRYLGGFKENRKTNVLSKIIDFTFQSNDQFLKRKLFEIAFESANYFVLTFSLEHAIRKFAREFSKLYEDNKELFTRIFERDFTKFLKLSLIYNFIMSLDQQEGYILEHRYHVETKVLSDLLAASASQIKPGCCLQDVKSRIDAQFQKVRECEAQLDNLRANNPTPKTVNPGDNPTFGMKRK